jgi:digeranylgeranylglycerophospholipid reductase
LLGEVLVEVAVVGGGVCGLFCSLTLAKQGIDVTVFEEHRSIGEPSHCAGHLSIQSLKRLGLYPLPKGIVENEYRGAVFHSSKGNSFEIEFDSPVTCSVNRKFFDRHLAELAIQAGAKLSLGKHVESLVIENHNVKGVNVKFRGIHENLKVKIVVDAEGISSRILRQAKLRTLNSSMLVKGVSAEVDHVRDIDEDFVEIYFGNAYAPSFYAWLMPRRDGTAKIGLATKRGNPKQFLEKFKRKHPIASKKLGKTKIIREAFHPITLGGPISRTFTNGFLVIGDAASQVKPTTGGGVILGMRCALIAAETIHNALKENNFSAESLSRYQRKWRKLMGFDMWVMLQMRKTFEQLSDNQIDKLILKCKRLELQKVLRNFSDIDFQGKSLARIAWHPSIINLGLYTIFRTLLSRKSFNSAS